MSKARIAVPVTWRAHDDLGIGHALLPRQTRYLCNRLVVAERFAWPVRLRCSPCQNRVDELEKGVATVQTA